MQVRFLIVFALGWLALTVLLLSIPFLPTYLCTSTADSLAICLRAIGLAASAHGSTVSFPPHGLFEIITECTALYVTPIFAAAVLAAPVNAREKLVALAWGIPFLLGLNLFRLVVLALVMIHWPSAFKFVHEYLWQVVFAGTVVLAWWLWCVAVLKRKVAVPRAAPTTGHAGA